jgi:hypothetical protein
VKRQRTDRAPDWLQVIEGGTPGRPDAVDRLRRFQREHPEVRVIAPPPGLYLYRAEIPEGSVPGDSREQITKSPDLAGLMDRMDDLFGPPSPPGGPG